jgi:hypothetical protein
LELQDIAVAHLGRDGWGAGLSVPDQAGREAVQKPGQQPPTPEPGSASQALEDLGLDSQANGQARPLHVLRWAATAVDLEEVTGMALEVDPQVGPAVWL